MPAEPTAHLYPSVSKVRAILDRPELAPLWRALRQRFETGQSVVRVKVGPLDAQQRAALADLLGSLRLPREFAFVSIARLDALLEEMTGHDSRTVVEILTGPLDNRAATRLADLEARRALWTWLTDHPVVRAEPTLDPWVAKVRQIGIVDGSVEKTRALLTQVLAVLDVLPADGVPLPTFAQETCGEPHALDDGRRLSALVLRALAALYDVPEPVDAERRRELWERAGVACDALSTVVLTAGLRPAETDPLSEMLRTWTDAGHACAITLAQLRHAPPPRLDAPTVWVVENPSLLASALARFGAVCPPLVCTSGWPNGAVILLLRRLRQSGTELCYHGDFDGDGLRIAAYVCAKTGATPWKMSHDDYLSAVPEKGPDPGRVTDAPWDTELATAIQKLGIAVPEERVTSELMADLQAEVRKVRNRHNATGESVKLTV